MRFILSSIILLIILSCSKNEKEKIESFYNFLIPDAINSYYGDSIRNNSLVLVSDGAGSNLDIGLESFSTYYFDSKDDLEILKEFEKQYEFQKYDQTIIDLNSQINFNIQNEFHDAVVGYFSITKPHFYSSTEALIYFEIFCGKKCGSGVFYILETKSRKWQIKDEIEVWGGRRF